MSWFDSEDKAPAGGEDKPAEAQDTQPKGDDKPDLTGKPDWLQDQFWTAPKEGEQPDYPAMLRKANDAWAETRKKVSDQGEQLAKYTVPDSTAPYFEGIDTEALLKANGRAGWTTEMLQQAAAQARSAGIGPAPWQAQVQAHLKSRHEATPEAKTPEAEMEAAIAELNGQGRPGSEMGKRMASIMGKLVSEGTLSKEGAEALIPRSAAAVEALNAILGRQGTSGPTGRTGGSTVANQTTWEALTARMADPTKFGENADPMEHQKTLKMMEASDSLIQARYGAEVDQLQTDSLTTHPRG